MGLYDTASLSNHEYLYKAMAFAEAHWIRGTRCTFTPCLSYTRDVESDYYPRMGDPVELNIALEDYDKASQDKGNWRAEKDDIPIQAYISNINYPILRAERRRLVREEGLTIKEALESCFKYDVMDREAPWFVPVLPYSMVEIPYFVHGRGVRKFRVTEVKADTLHEYMWYCKLATHRDQVDLQPITPDEVDNHTDYRMDRIIEGNSFLKRPSGGNGVDPSYSDSSAWVRGGNPVDVDQLDNRRDHSDFPR